MESFPGSRIPREGDSRTSGLSQNLRRLSNTCLLSTHPIFHSLEFQAFPLREPEMRGLENVWLTPKVLATCENHRPG